MTNWLVVPPKRYIAVEFKGGPADGLKEVLVAPLPKVLIRSKRNYDRDRSLDRGKLRAYALAVKKSTII